MNDQSAAKPRGGVLTWALWGAAAIGAAAVVYIIAQSATKPADERPAAASGAVPVAAVTHDVAKKLEHPADGTQPPAYVFFDGTGKRLTPADFKGKVVVMNLWATCIDKADALEQAKAFIAQNAPLAFYNDPEAKLPWALKPAANGMPTTLILGKDGLERGRISGEADWAGPGAKAVIDKLLAAN